MPTIGVLRETGAGERRVALTPEVAARLIRDGYPVIVEAGAGGAAWFGDEEYRTAGARVGERKEVYADSDVLLGLAVPADVELAHAGQTLIGLLRLVSDPAAAQRLATAGVVAADLELLPRTLPRAQAMDALTSQANVAGYKAAIVAAETYGGYFPMLMTAAGTTRPAQVLVLGAGVAGLQAIATARRLGAMVTAYDVRAEAHADIVSTGAAVLDLGPVTVPSAGGYARELDAAETGAQQRALLAAVARFDVVITTAQVPGRRPPVLVPAAAVAAMGAGSVLVDLAASPLGGNVEGSVPGASTVTAGGVTVVGAGDLAASVPRAASTAYARNVLAVLSCLFPAGGGTPDPGDEVVAGLVVTRDGEIVHPRVRALLSEVPS